MPVYDRNGLTDNAADSCIVKSPVVTNDRAFLLDVKTEQYEIPGNSADHSGGNDTAGQATKKGKVA
jgi:hypothetical protein